MSDLTPEGLALEAAYNEESPIIHPCAAGHLHRSPAMADSCGDARKIKALTTQLDEAREALRLANLEIARLKGVIRRVAESMGHSGGEAPEYLPCNDSCSDCDDETIGEKHRSDLPEDRCSEHPDADGELDCWRCLLTAALTPKEPSDG